MQTESAPEPWPSTSALDDCPDAVVSTDAAGVVLRWNAAAARMTGRSADAALGRPLAEVLTLTPRDESGLFPERHWARCGSAAVPVELCAWSSPEAGQLVTHRLLHDCSSRVAHETESDRAAEILRAQARSDALTGLSNRYELEDRLDESLTAVRSGHVALLVADLDGFKAINDRYGHSVGDEVLAAVARRLRACVRDGDTVARLGGDEFVILTTVNGAVEPSDLARRVRQALSDPVQTSDGVLRVGASVGVAVADADTDAADLLRRADKAMYRVKLARG